MLIATQTPMWIYELCDYHTGHIYAERSFNVDDAPNSQPFCEEIDGEGEKFVQWHPALPE